MAQSEKTAIVPSKIDPTDPVWYKAATLAERMASLRTARAGLQNPRFDADLAEKRLARWRSGPAFANDERGLVGRLAAEGATEDDLRRLLGESGEALRDRHTGPPAWLRELEQAFSKPPTGGPPYEPADAGDRGFLEMVAPLIERGRDRVRREAQELAGKSPDAPFDPNTIENLLLSPLLEQLHRVMGRTMVLELNVARLRGDLVGDTPEERFDAFIEHLSRRAAALSILREYPVLARQLAECVDRWVQVSLEFIRRLIEDWTDIRHVFCPGEDAGELVELEASAGDLHRGGRCVYVATFDSELRLVYKPRSLAVDTHFQALLSWLNERGTRTPFRTLRIMDRGAYGWVEHVEAHGCTSLGQVRRFYERQGGYLALLYALHALDFHSENLIAAGEHPVPIDLEALFHSGARGEGTRDASPPDVAIRRSVLGVGLLPERIWGSTGREEGIDISGLGGRPAKCRPLVFRTGKDLAQTRCASVASRWSYRRGITDRPCKAQRSTYLGTSEK